MTRANVASVSTQLRDFLGEVEPRADALIAIMIDAFVPLILFLFDDSIYGTCQVESVGRRAYLVEHHVQRVAFLRQSAHRLHKVVTAFRVEPCRTEYQGIATHLLDCLLPFQLRLPVNTQGIDRHILRARNATVARKHIVRRNVDERRAVFLTRNRQILDCIPIDSPRRRLVVFRLIHIRVGGTVHDNIHLVLLHYLTDSLDVGNIQLRHVRKQISIGTILGDQTHLVAKLSVRPRNQYDFLLCIHNSELIIHNS